jgi:hypothetical protein
VLLACDLGDALHKTNHSLIAVRVKFVVVSCLQRDELFSSILGWVFRDLWLDGVLEVGQEPHSVFQLDLEGLVVNGGPGAGDVLFGAVLAPFAELGFGLELVHELDSVSVLRLEQPLVLVVDHLELVREFMGANFVTLEQINCIGLGIDMEVPHSEDLASQTMDRLICLDNQRNVLEG